MRRQVGQTQSASADGIGMRTASSMHQHAPPFLPPVPQSNGAPQRAQVRRRCGKVVWPGTGIIGALSEVTTGKINHAEVGSLR
jgi:hypothetical protein